MTESANGLHSLVDPVAEDVKVVVLLDDFISHVLENFQKRSEGGFHSNHKFLCHTLDFLTYLQDYYSRNAANNCLISDILSQLRQLLVVISESVYITAASCICEEASENVVTVPNRTKSQLRELVCRTNGVTDIVIILQNSAHELLRKMSKNRILMDEEEDSMVTMSTRSRQVIYLLEGCEILLSAVSSVIREKAVSERRFFNTSSLAIGAVCAGRVAWQLFKGVGTEEMVQTGLWASSIGVSALVLQVPRLKMSEILKRLEFCEKEYQKLQTISKNWKLSSEWSFASLVRLPSPSNGIRFSLK